MIRWVAAVIGYFIYRFPGAIAGFVIGSLFDNMGGKKTGGFQEVFKQQRGDRVTPADFELNLLSLASLVIKADGNVSQSELDYVRKYFVQAYGKERANATFDVFNNVIKNVKYLHRTFVIYYDNGHVTSLDYKFFTSYLVLPMPDGHVSPPEVIEIGRISGFLGVQMRDFESIKAMFFKNPDSAYKILEIERTATDAQIKKAYRDMVKKYHPDKLQHMDEAYQKGAQEKFNKVQEAYEQLQKERGF